MRGLEGSAEKIYVKIREEWKNHGWSWESKNGEVAQRMATLIPDIFAVEFQSINNALALICENSTISASSPNVLKTLLCSTKN